MTTDEAKVTAADAAWVNYEPATKITQGYQIPSALKHAFRSGFLAALSTTGAKT